MIRLLRKLDGRSVGKYKILFNRAYIKDLKKIPVRNQKQLKEKVKELSLDPRPEGYKKLHGHSTPPLYRVRSGDYRIVYAINDKELIVLLIDVVHRKGIYRGLC